MSKRLGFTLIELLIVMAIVGVLLTVVVINMGSSASMAVSMATQDSLRIIRYARNMALQTQQPIDILFAHGKIAIIPTEMSAITTPTEDATKNATHQGDNLEDNEATAASTLSQDPNRLEGNGFDTIGLTKYYQNVHFQFLSYNDNLVPNTRTSKHEHNTFERRIDLNSTPTETDEEGNTTFTLTIRANGTMRPCSFQVYSCDETGEGDPNSGNTVTFDFLCTGTIADDE